MILHPHRRLAFRPPPPLPGWGLDLAAYAFASSAEVPGGYSPKGLRNLAFHGYGDGWLLTGYRSNSDTGKSEFFQFSWLGSLADTTVGSYVKAVGSGTDNFCASYSPDGARLVHVAAISGGYAQVAAHPLPAAFDISELTIPTVNGTSGGASTGWAASAVNSMRGCLFSDGLRIVVSTSSTTYSDYAVRLHSLASAWGFATASETPSATLDLASFHGSGDGQVSGTPPVNVPVCFCFSPDGMDLLAACGGRLYYAAMPAPFDIANAALVATLSPDANFPSPVFGVAVHPVSHSIVVSGGAYLYEYAPASAPQQEEP